MWTSGGGKSPRRKTASKFSNSPSFKTRTNHVIKTRKYHVIKPFLFVLFSADKVSIIGLAFAFICNCISMSLLLALLNTKHLQQKLCNFLYHLKTGKYSDSIIFNDNLGILLSLFESKVKWCDTCFKVNWPTEVSLSLPKGTWLWNSRNCWTPPSTPMPAVFFCIFDFLCVCAWTVQHSYHHHYNPAFLMR